MPSVFDHGSEKWSARQDLHLRSPGPKPGMLLLHYALRRPRLRRATEPGLGQAGHQPWKQSHREDSEIGGPGGACTFNPPADNGVLCIELRVQKWWAVLVTLQPSASGWFCDPGFTDRQPGHYRNGSGGGSRTHEGRAYEARLNLILPAVKWWSRWVTLPHQPACKAGALLVCHDPLKLAGCLRAARSGLSFGDSAAC